MKTIKLYSLLLLATIVASSCSYTSKTTISLLEEAKKKTTPYDLIIVPGVPFEDDSWSRIMKARVYWSKYLIDEGITTNVMYSGSAVYTPFYEAEIMSLYAQEIGIPEHKIYTEKKAEHSTENLYYSFKLAKKLGFKNIALASDPFQSKMLEKFAHKVVSPDIEFVPIVFDKLRELEPYMVDPEIDAQKAYAEDFVSLVERESFRERFKGTRGQKLNNNYYD
ncbi:MAG: YdcF family protein [Bacteroidales bacterium]|nr:YdcF family protein [Bacteroidales bacterium]